MKKIAIFLLSALCLPLCSPAQSGGQTNNYGPSIVTLTTTNNYFYVNTKRILTTYDIAEFYNGLMTSTDRTNWDGKWTPGVTADGAALTNLTRSSVIGLLDADTNSILRSGRYASWTTNQFQTTNTVRRTLPGTFTNVAGMDYTVLTGFTTPYWAWAGTTNWNEGTITTTGAVTISFLDGDLATLDTPINPSLTNIIIYTMERPDLFGRTNKLVGQTLETDDPTSASQITTKRYVDAAVSAVNYVQNGGIYLIGSPLNLNSEWTEIAGTNGLAWRYLGADVMRAENPTLAYATVTSIKLTNTVVWLTIWTNGVTSTPSPQWTFDLAHPQWTTLSSVTNTYPTASGTNFTISFQMPNPTNAFIRVAIVSAQPNFIRLSALLSTPPRTITNGSDSTFGNGPGVVTWDTNYLYISVATNGWKRAALSTW